MSDLVNNMGKTGTVTLLIAAMGGEGGGVLSNWVIDAAKAENYIVQSTSIPGVAQRTGATTYYIEFLHPDNVGDHRPVMSLYPAVTGIDVMVATELVEAGRAMERGFVTPERTTLIGSTHRFYAMSEKTAMGDGRFEGGKITRAAGELAKQALLFDMDRLARQTGSVINAVMLGAIAGSGALPFSVSSFEAAIQSSDKAVESNLAAFRAGLARAKGEIEQEQVSGQANIRRVPDRKMEKALARMHGEFPHETHAVIELAIERLIDFQGPGYANKYLDHMTAILACDNSAGAKNRLTKEVARQLVLWMCYEDVIRVAQAKTRPERFEDIAREAAAKPGQPVHVVDYLKPGLEEMASLMPAPIGRALVAWAEKGGWLQRAHIGLHIKTSSISGFLIMRLLANLKFLRPMGYRYGEENRLIRKWLENIRIASSLSEDLALEICACAQLLKGYGETHRRGRRNFHAIIENLVTPALAGQAEARASAQAISLARQAALADESGKALSSTLQRPAA